MISVLDWSHETVFPAAPLSAGLARDFVRGHLIAHQLSHLVEDLRLVVSELATNAVLHAHTPFQVVLSMKGDTVWLVIRDASTAAVIRSAPHALDVNGRGLVIVESLSQDWGSWTDGLGNKSVWASFHSG